MVNYQSKIKVQYYFGLLLFVCSVFLVGCKKDNDEDGPNFPSTSEKVIVCGRILNEWNSPIENAEVTLGSTTVLTDANGLYALNQVAIPGQGYKS
ncbi:MAG: carboxypeptidase regulatory-like domain-containing protein [Bacteroidetes bacterium]|nr:carboxypeptidase regulatory-like domain-containing protein [Bacteroidota bacterium]